MCRGEERRRGGGGRAGGRPLRAGWQPKTRTPHRDAEKISLVFIQLWESRINPNSSFISLWWEVSSRSGSSPLPVGFEVTRVDGIPEPAFSTCKKNLSQLNHLRSKKSTDNIKINKVYPIFNYHSIIHFQVVMGCTAELRVQKKTVPETRPWCGIKDLC